MVVKIFVPGIIVLIIVFFHTNGETEKKTKGHDEAVLVKEQCKMAIWSSFS